jgi:hypothetical protein
MISGRRFVCSACFTGTNILTDEVALKNCGITFL